MITRTRGRDAHIEKRAFALSDMVRWGYSGLRNIKPQVGEKQAKGIPALHRAVRLRAEAVASLNLYCWKGDGPTRQRIDTVWQARLFKNGPQPTATNPVQTRFGFWETVEESLAWRGNAFIWKNIDPATGRIVEWWALHPDQVTAEFDANGESRYRVEVAPGFVDPYGRGKGIYFVGIDTILHIRGHGEGGQILAPSPIEVFKKALEGPIGRQAHEARVWRRGTALQGVITMPANVSKEQAEQWREVWRSNYEGTDGETTAVLGGGMEIKPIGMTMQDAQFVEMYDLTAKDASSIMGVPANLLGVQVTNVRSNLEDDLMAWLRFGLGPELGRIEDSLYADPDLFGGSQTMPGFDTSDFVRGDLATEATILIGLVQAGILTSNEGRHKLGYERDTDPASDQLQQTPVGGAENPGLSLPKLKPSEGETPSDDGRGRRLEELTAEVRSLRFAPRDELHLHVPPQHVTIEQASTIVEAPPPVVVPAPVVNVPEQRMPEVHVDAPAVTVNVPEERERPDPVVHVHVDVPEQAAPTVNVNVPDRKPRRMKVERLPNGFLDAISEEE